MSGGEWRSGLCMIASRVFSVKKTKSHMYSCHIMVNNRDASYKHANIHARVATSTTTSTYSRRHHCINIWQRKFIILVVGSGAKIWLATYICVHVLRLARAALVWHESDNIYIHMIIFRPIYNIAIMIISTAKLWLYILFDVCEI